MAAAQYLYLLIVFNLSLFLALAQEENQFIYHGFDNSKLQLGGLAKILPNGLLRLTNTSELESGYAFYPSPFKFNSSSSQTLSFSTTFVFAMVSKAVNFGGNGLAFFISPSMNFTGAVAGAYLGLFNLTNNGQPNNHILAVELDTVESPEFYDIDGNHVGIDVNSLISNQSATASYISNKEKGMKLWTPLKIPKPNGPLLSKHLDLSEVLLESMYVGLSAATGTRISDHYILGWSFNKSGPAQNLDISKLPPPPPIPPPEKTSEGLGRTITVLLVAIAVVLITVGGAVYIVRKKKYEEVYEVWEKEYGPHRLSYKNLYKATKGFKEKEVIGQGGFGQVYRGVLPSNVQIAVKRISHNSNEGMKQFVAEIGGTSIGL
ncbi:hypothetical protein Pint_32767 [Pistacia integerrima]|uniref:Uncharacterized protein n=1 Tax=Pistacia integerrima TaxID=434235 RepID=A0ACC0XMV1_9ROSI|nr:hypothetical protein Pint_32767 [Pistacia integerrima]